MATQTDFKDAPVDDDIKTAMMERGEHLDRRISALRSEIERLTAQLTAAEHEREALRGLLALWGSPNDEHIRTHGNGAVTISVGTLQTEDAADLVIRLLGEIGRPLHYREIEKQLRARGWYIAGGADPANTLLAKYFDDSRLYRPSRGVYAIRPEGQTVRSVGSKRKATQRSRSER